MFLPKKELVIINDKVSYMENEKIHKEEMLMNQEKEKARWKQDKTIKVVNFTNAPLANWKIQIDYAIPTNCNHGTEHIILTHPTNDFSICIPLIKFSKNIENLTILKGVIQEKILILNDSYNIDFVVEGTKEYDEAVILLNSEEEKISIKDLKVGNKVLLKNNFNASDLTYLGAFFFGKCRACKEGTYYNVPTLEISKIEKRHFFIGKDIKGKTRIQMYKQNFSGFKEMILLEDTELNISYKTILKNNFIDREYPLLESFVNKNLINKSQYKYEFYNLIFEDAKMPSLEELNERLSNFTDIKCEEIKEQKKILSYDKLFI